ncbi:MAG TPA: flavodoxin domain-containing protein [Chitinophagales bacterium]|nr:flavodoxin domain-containing protein [Chitinophagales bacterium]
MENGIVIYESRYGAARQYAQWIGEKLNLPAKESSELSPWELAAYDFVIAGSSIYMGKILLRNWLLKNESALLSKNVIFFIVGAAPVTETEKTEKYFSDNIPTALLRKDNHFYLQGKSVFSELSLADKFFLKIGAWLAKSPEDKKAMLTDFNAVKPGNLNSLLNATPQLFCQQVKAAKSETAKATLV